MLILTYLYIFSKGKFKKIPKIRGFCKKVKSTTTYPQQKINIL